MSMESKILHLPETWVEVKLGDFVENDKGKKPKNESKEQTAVHHLPYVDIQTFEENIVRTWTDGVGCRLCSETDFLMVWDGSRSGLVGKGVNGALGSTLVRINFPSMVNDYAYYFLQSKYQQINTRAKGSGTPHVDPDLLWNYKFPIPPIAEQHRIVAKIEELFSELDNGIENLNTARAQLKVYRQALLKHAFEGKLTAQWREENKDKLENASALQQRIQTERAARYQQQLTDWQALGQKGSKPKAPKTLPPLNNVELAELPALPEGWLGARLGWMTCSVEYGTSAKSSETGICPVLRMGNIQNGSFDLNDLVFTDDKEEIAKYLLKEGDVLFNRTNSPEWVGKSAIFKSKHPTIFAGYLIRLNQIPAIVDSQYLNFFLNSHIAKKHGNKVKTDGVNQSNINGDKLVNYPFPFCSLEEQKVIVEHLEVRLSKVDQLDQIITNALQQSEALRQSILKKAFSGTLVSQDTNDEPAWVLLTRIKSEKTALSPIQQIKPIKMKRTMKVNS